MNRRRNLVPWCAPTVAMSVYIVRAFVQMRDRLAANLAGGMSGIGVRIGALDAPAVSR